MAMQKLTPLLPCLLFFRSPGCFHWHYQIHITARQQCNNVNHMRDLGHVQVLGFLLTPTPRWAKYGRPRPVAVQTCSVQVHRGRGETERRTRENSNRRRGRPTQTRQFRLESSSSEAVDDRRLRHLAFSSPVEPRPNQGRSVARTVASGNEC